MMKKNKPRWENVSAYELAKKKALGLASPEEMVAAEKASAIRLAGGRPKINSAAGRLVVR